MSIDNINSAYNNRDVIIDYDGDTTYKHRFIWIRVPLVPSSNNTYIVDDNIKDIAIHYSFDNPSSNIKTERINTFIKGGNGYHGRTKSNRWKKWINNMLDQPRFYTLKNKLKQ